MKKRILALLLAGILTASMGSCISREKNRDETGDGGLEGVNPPVSTETLPPVTAWEEADDTVYTTKVNVNLRANISSSEGIVSVSGATKLHRVKKSSTWSVVEYDGKEYYVESASLTTNDIFGEGFVACNPAETMYVSNVNGLYIRKYAAEKTAVPISDVLGEYSFNEVVTVIAKGDSWCKVKKTVENGEIVGFVARRHLSNTISENPLTKDYSPYFETCEPREVSVLEGLSNLNCVPVKEVKIHLTLNVTKEKPVTLIVTGTGKGEYADWYRISYPDAVKEGDPQTYTTCYIHRTCLKGEAGGVSVDEFLTAYPGFTKCTVQTLYVLASTQGMNARKTPVFEGTENIGAWLAPKTGVKVVASGMAEGLLRYVIEYDDGSFYFVTAKYLTPNESGEEMALTLPDILVLYPDFTATLPTKDLYATGKVNCYKSPSVSETVPHSLSAGSKVAQVAKSKDGVWCVIQLEDGTLYFAGTGLFSEQAPVG